MAPLIALYEIRIGAAWMPRVKKHKRTTTLRANSRYLLNRISSGSFHAHAGERVDGHERMRLICRQHPLGSLVVPHRLNRIENNFADQNHAFVRSRELLLALVERGLGSLARDILRAHVAAKWRVFAPVVGFFLRLRFRLPARRQLSKELRVEARVVVHCKKRKAVIVVRRDEHEVGVVRARAQSFARLLEVSKLGIADLQDARQREALLIDVLGVCGRSPLARYDFHAVRRLDRVEGRNVFEIKKPTAPCSVIGIGAVKSREMCRIGAILDEVKPVIIIYSRGLQRSLSSGIRKRFVPRQLRQIILLWAQVREDEPALLLHRIRQMFDLAGKVTVPWLRRHSQTLPANVEQPAMIGTPNPAVLDIAIFQRGAAMRTVLANQAELASLIAKQHQLFTQDFDRHRNVVEIT